MLSILYNNQQVGTLWTESRLLHFRYDKKWLSTKTAFFLTPRLPLSDQIYVGDEVSFFFSNLLPEGPVLASFLKLKHLPVGDVYAQLEALGEDGAGAFSIVIDNKVKQRKPTYRAYSLRVLRADINRLAKNLPLLFQHEDLRLSLAGAQNKIPVKYESGKFWLPVEGAASTHILKPAFQPEREFPASVNNEALCLCLAQLCGLNAVEAEILRLPELVLLIRRYDRQIDKSTIVRRHQLDFCQLAGVLPDQKYQKDGGPSIATLFSLIDQYSVIPGQDRLKVVDWIIYNYLIGNADAHGKNLAMLVAAEGKLMLAPAYDMLSTAIYPNLNKRMAMAIGGEYRPEWVRKKNWQQFAESIHINASLLKKRSLELAKKVMVKIPEASALVKVRARDSVADKIKRVIAQRARWLETHQEGL